MDDFLCGLVREVPEGDIYFGRLQTRFGDRKKSLFVATLRYVNGKSTREFSEALGISESYFNNKMFRNSWSFEDLVTLAGHCGYAFVLNYV